MKIVIPMAGEGKRFAQRGYTTHKPAIPTIDRRTGRLLPMVVCAALDLPNAARDGGNVIFIDRDFHRRDGVEAEILKSFPKASFVTVDHLTEGQACTCLLAKDRVSPDEELLIAGCDNGMIMDMQRFDEEKRKADCLVFTYRHNEAVLADPCAYGWMRTDDDGNVTGVSIKKPISDAPMNDHAVVATFWFKRSESFVRAARKMIAEDDRVNGEFYVDEVVKHMLELGFRVRVFEIDRYIGWGTPKDHEEYMDTVRYWDRFINDPRYPLKR